MNKQKYAFLLILTLSALTIIQAPIAKADSVTLIESLGWNKRFESPILAGYLTAHHESPNEFTSAHASVIYVQQTFNLSKIELILSRSSTPTTNIYLRVYVASDGYAFGQDGFCEIMNGSAPIVSSAPINASTLASGTWGAKNFTFSPTYTITGGNFYILSLEVSASGGLIDDSNRVYIQFFNTTDAIHEIQIFNNNYWQWDTPAICCRFISRIYGNLGATTTYYWVECQNGTYGGYMSPNYLHIEPVGTTMTLTATGDNASMIFLYWQYGNSRVGPNPWNMPFTKNSTIYPVFRKTSPSGALGASTLNIVPVFIGVGVAGFIIILTRRRQE